jgi:hypothetical protein
MRTRILVAALLAVTGVLAARAQKPPRLVEAAAKPSGPWKAYPTRTLDDLPAAAPDSNLSRYGGRRDRKVEARGFFYARKIEGRWWLVDPDGCLFLHKAVVSVNTLPTPGARAALEAKFGDEERWAEQTTALLREHGFNGTGAWSRDETLRATTARPVTTRIWNFMSAYGRKRGGTFQQSGHTGYPKDCIFVFDPEFETFCDQHARQLAAGKNDPWLLGHFSDNELPFRRTALRGYLSLPETDPGHRAARQWLRERHGEKATEKNITARDEEDFLALVVRRYFRIVSAAIKKYDPNHLFLGSRIHGSALRFPEVFRAAGPFLDVTAVNYYGAWTPDPERLALWEREAGKPILITEWYIKGADSGMANTGGAGWVVRTQRDRGRFYQNFALGLLESKVCVGWHWFKYSDNDPANTQADPSNRDSNKGIVSAGYEPYPPLLQAMRQLNRRAYALADYFDRSSPNRPSRSPAKGPSSDRAIWVSARPWGLPVSQRTPSRTAAR